MSFTYSYEKLIVCKMLLFSHWQEGFLNLYSVCGAPGYFWGIPRCLAG